MKILLLSAAVTSLALAFGASAAPAPTQAQKDQVENCKILSGAVFEFAEARDKKQPKMDAFKSVTHGQNYVPGSLLDETLQWAYAHPDEQPDTASGHFYARCVLDAYDARNPDSEGALDLAAVSCQQAHNGAPDAIRDCIDSKTQDLIANPQSAIAAVTSAAPAAATAVVAAQAPPPATATAVAAAPPPAPAAPQSAPAAAPLVATPAVVATPQAAAPTLIAPVVPISGPGIAAASVPPAPPIAAPAPTVAVPPPSAPAAVTPVAVTQPIAPAPVVPVAVPAAPVVQPAPVVAEAASPQAPPQVINPPQPTPVVAKAVTPQPAVAAAPVATKPVVSAPAVTMAPLPSPHAAQPGEFPADLAGYGKLSVGMQMDDAYKALGSHGDTDYDDQGEVHTYMIGEDHGFMELRPSRDGTLHSIRVVGGADAHQPPVLSVTLGDAAFILINAVGLPTSRTPLPGDKELWNYRGRNYAWEISPGGDVIGLRIIDISVAAPSAATDAAPP